MRRYICVLRLYEPRLCIKLSQNCRRALEISNLAFILSARHSTSIYSGVNSCFSRAIRSVDIQNSATTRFNVCNSLLGWCSRLLNCEVTMSFRSGIHLEQTVLLYHWGWFNYLIGLFIHHLNRTHQTLNLQHVLNCKNKSLLQDRLIWFLHLLKQPHPLSNAIS